MSGDECRTISMATRAPSELIILLKGWHPPRSNHAANVLRNRLGHPLSLIQGRIQPPSPNDLREMQETFCKPYLANIEQNPVFPL